MNRFLPFLRVYKFKRCISGGSKILPGGPPLGHFVKQTLGEQDLDQNDFVPYIPPEDLKAKGRKGIVIKLLKLRQS